MSSEPARPADVLYVDSDPADALMAQESFAQAGNNVRLHIARDGRQALRFVRKLGEFRGAPRPRLILLELSLADLPGLGVLAELKCDRDLMTIPVVVFSSSQDRACIRRSYALHANAYVVKPADFDGFAAVIRQLSASLIWGIQPPPGTARR
jgi:CheY-like chemotaxis protein